MARDTEKAPDTDQVPAADDAPDPGTSGTPRGKGEGGKSGKPRGKGKQRNSKPASTLSAAAQTRTVMQRRHRRIGFAMTAALGAEVAGVAGMVAGSLRDWEWGQRLWGHTGGPAWAAQVALALAAVALVVAWFARGETLPARLRVAALPLAAVVGVVAVALVWQAPPGSRGGGGVITAVATVPVLAGAAGWLVGLKRLRLLFPFGLKDARVHGFGNLPAVRRAQLLGGPVGAVGGIAVVAGALLVGPGLVSTEDSNTADPLALTGSSPAGDGGPAWQISLPANESRAAAVWATSGGLVIGEQQGVRGVDPRDGSTRWHWRDDAYHRVGGGVTEDGTTVVLAMEYDGDQAGRDRVVALDTATGELRWNRYDDDLVSAMSTVVVSPEQGDWFVVPVVEQLSEAAGPAPVALQAIEAGSGEVRWRFDRGEGCNFVAVNADSPGVVTAAQECTGGQDGDGGGGGGCQVAALDAASGEPAWSWPPEDPDAEAEPVTGCQVTSTAELVFVSYQQGSNPASVALDPQTGEPAWTPSEEDGPAGLSNPAVVGDAVLGTEFAADPSGAGSGTLVIRDVADGALREQVELPPGQPIGIAPVGDGDAVISQYRPENAEVVLLGIDVAAAEVGSESVVATAPEGSSFRAVNVTVGPQTLTVDTLLAAGQQPAPGDYTLQVHGWAG